VISQDRSVRTAKDMAQHEGSHDRVIQWANDRQEL